MSPVGSLGRFFRRGKPLSDYAALASGLLPTRRKKGAQLPIGLLGRLFTEIMAARQCDRIANVGRVVPPHLCRFVIAPDRPGGAPEHQRRAFDLASSRKINGVHVEIHSEGGAIVLAHGMDGGGVAEA